MGFLNLFSSSGSSTQLALSKTSKADEARIVQTLGIRQLDAMPTQAAKAFQLSCNPKATLEDFVQIVESDEVLTARIIRIANSVYFRRGEESKDISKAVASIGLNEIKCLLSATMLKSLLKSKSKFRSNIWANSIATGIGARLLATSTNIPSGEAFLAGILHDVGKLIFIDRLPKEYEGAMQKMYNSEDGSVKIEEQLFDLNHVEVGKWLAEKWSFPDVVRSAITYHHNNWSKDDRDRGKGTTHAMLVKCADILSHSLRLGHPTSMTFLGTVSKKEFPSIALQLNQNIETVESWATQLQSQFDQEFSMYSAD
jgi:HD-like signal output (HDOD) protein